ncbi:MAG: biosynthetic-type acetolactate synthase large subunit, partial [Tannerella sp.]|jgi:acetolactate synthase-1/2/3 large subunit|nr:biosynthetic-type acetolactate synthase large subunit [Tannerella sp.]
MIDSTPIVVITGQVPSPLLGTDAFQEIDMIGIALPVTKWAYQVRKAEEIAWAVSRAFYIALSGRPGPVLIDFAKDAQTATVDYTYQPVRFIRSYQPVPEADPENLTAAAALIDGARKPFAAVGQGVILSGAEQALSAFLEKADIPAGTTMLGLSSMPSDCRLNKGMLGMHGNIAPNRKTNECDVLIAIGMRFDDRVTGDLNTYARQAKIIHIDIDLSEIGKNVPVDIPLPGDAKDILKALTARISPARHSKWIASFDDDWREEEIKVIRKEVRPESGPLHMGEVVRKVSEATGHDAVLATDVGQNQMMAVRYFRYRRTRSLVSSGGLGTMGYGLPAAIGAKLGAPERTVCCFVGDGGLQMTLQELGTVMQEKLNLKIILLNNSFLGMVRQWQELFWHERYSFTAMENPDFAAIARAYRLGAREVSRREELDDAIREMLDCDGGYLLVVHVEKSGKVYPMVPAGKSLNDMIVE